MSFTYETAGIKTITMQRGVRRARRRLGVPHRPDKRRAQARFTRAVPVANVGQSVRFEPAPRAPTTRPFPTAPSSGTSTTTAAMRRWAGDPAQLRHARRQDRAAARDRRPRPREHRYRRGPRQPAAGRQLRIHAPAPVVGETIDFTSVSTDPDDPIVPGLGPRRRRPVDDARGHGVACLPERGYSRSACASPTRAGGHGTVAAVVVTPHGSYSSRRSRSNPGRRSASSDSPAASACGSTSSRSHHPWRHGEVPLQRQGMSAEDRREHARTPGSSCGYAGWSAGCGRHAVYWRLPSPARSDATRRSCCASGRRSRCGVCLPLPGDTRAKKCPTDRRPATGPRAGARPRVLRRSLRRRARRQRLEPRAAPRRPARRVTTPPATAVSVADLGRATGATRDAHPKDEAPAGPPPEPRRSPRAPCRAGHARAQVYTPPPSTPAPTHPSPPQPDPGESFDDSG